MSDMHGASPEKDQLSGAKRASSQPPRAIVIFFLLMIALIVYASLSGE